VGRGIGEILTFAVGVAVSPLPIIAVILMLFSRRARVNGLAFLAGWIVGLAAVSGIVYTLAANGDAGSDPTASHGISWLKIVLGIVLLWLAARRWRTRPGPGADPDMPRWMRSIEGVAPGRAAALGAALVAANPKNLILTIGAAAGLAQIGLSNGEAIVSLVVFIVVASVTIAAPVIYFLSGGARAEARLDEAKNWLRANDATVMTVLLLIFGVDLIAKGITLLS
jgi:hypothetical protein